MSQSFDLPLSIIPLRGEHLWQMTKPLRMVMKQAELKAGTMKGRLSE
jgi:hypothetical protein